MIKEAQKKVFIRYRGSNRNIYDGSAKGKDSVDVTPNIGALRGVGTFIRILFPEM